jgi:hypothetical protein
MSVVRLSLQRSFDTVEYRPNAANAYREKVRNLKRRWQSRNVDSRAAANEAIREIVGKVDVHPCGAYKPVETRCASRPRSRCTASLLNQVMGFRRFSMRGLEKVRGEWSLVTGAWNIKRMFVLMPA